MMSIKVETDGEFITKIVNDELPDMIRDAQRRIMDSRETALRAALEQSGWTPPEKSLPHEPTKSMLSYAKHRTNAKTELIRDIWMHMADQALKDAE